MTKAKSRHGKLKGAVLLMVLAVMTVLIIMLAGAMAIASTATNRANTNYEESQAYYTARSGVDVLTQTIMGDSKYKSDGSGGLTAIASGSSDKSQALELEEAIAGVLETNGAGKPVYNVSKSLKAWDSINDPQATQLKAAYPSSWQNIIDNSYMEFDVSDISWVDSTSGMMADPGDGNVKVKIQLLKLIYDDGSGAGINRNAISAAQSADLSGGSSSTYYIKDMWVLMECTATYNGISATVSKVITPVEKEKATNVGFTSVGSAGLNNNVDVLGGTVTGGNFNWGNNGVTAGSIFINGNVDINAQKELSFKTGESMVVNGDFKAQNNTKITANKTAGKPANEDPFIFVRNTLKLENNLELNTSNTSNDFKVIVGNLEQSGDQMKTIKGNLYIDNYLNINGGLQNAGGKQLTDGDLFISDRSSVTAAVTTSYNGNGSWTSGGNTFKKSYIQGIVRYTVDHTNNKIETTIDTGSQLWNNVLKTGDFSSLASGTIYYYYKADTSSVPAVYEGCMELHAIRQALLDLYPTNAIWQSQVTSKFVEVNTDNLKYVIQMDKSNFMDNMAVSTSSVTMSETPSYLMKISLPTNDTGRLAAADMISLPTLFSKYSQYFDLDQTTHDFVVDSSATPVVTITNLKYKDHTQDSAPTVNKNWKTVLQGVYSDLSAAAGSRDYATAFTKVWDIMTALYDPDDASGATMNVHFRTPALQAKNDGVSTFSDYSKLSSIQGATKSISDLTTYTNDSNYLEVDTSAGNVILLLKPSGVSEECYYSGGNAASTTRVFPAGKKGIVVKGNGYLYVICPKTGVNNDTYAFKDFKLITESYYNNCLNSSKVAVAGSVGGSVPNVESPKIMWYLDDGVTMRFYNGGDTTLMGYLYGPGASFYVDAGLGGEKTMYYKKDLISKQILPSFMGSAFVNNIGGANNFGLVYIPPEETKQPHEAKFSWQTGVVGYSYNGIKTAPAT